MSVVSTTFLLSITAFPPNALKASMHCWSAGWQLAIKFSPFVNPIDRKKMQYCQWLVISAFFKYYFFSLSSITGMIIDLNLLRKFMSSCYLETGQIFEFKIFHETFMLLTTPKNFIIIDKKFRLTSWYESLRHGLGNLATPEKPNFKHYWMKLCLTLK